MNLEVPVRYVITGAGSGIGHAVATLAARAAGSDGAGQVRLALLDRDADSIRSLASELRGTGADCLPVAVDLSDPPAVGEAVEEAVSAFGGLDALVSNAGISSVGAIEDLSLDAYQRTFDVNTRATFLLARAAFPALRDSRGSIVATASISATHPTPPLGMYSASKAALRVMIQQMAVEWGRYGIRANCVSPGPTDTGLTRGSFGDPEDAAAKANRRYREAVSPMRKIGRAEDIAQAVVFLAGPRAGHITGVDLPVDGGLSLTVMPLTGGTPGYRLDEIAQEATSR
ncbi:SDR family NAD(P)-dependent oxidoreductase [Streptomyces sp. NBC_01716]|uniref:SDR family NAD(P)-dependent oxidoreductase n=1 Tax=Streptomyces sp. NBC_01716 TaxID=2975917 RepID=UPI002E33CECF|nr:SDR family NAD(P)-dependent oxidoreductase [Streptomyces sp. NBC_01716]